MDEKTIGNIVNEYGTPIYIYDTETIKENHARLKHSIHPSVEIFYSMKANPALAVCKFMKNLGCGIEIASAGELFIAAEAGFEPRNILFSGPGKTKEEIGYAILSNIYCINVESYQEACLIDQIAGTHKKKVRVALRVNPDFNASGSTIRMTGVASQFGIDVLLLEGFFESVRKLENIKIIGIQVYLGTQILDAAKLIRNFEEIVRLAMKISDMYGVKLEFLDFGGGYGVPYFPNENPLDMAGMGKGIREVLHEYRIFLNGIRLVTECGRFLVAESGVYVTRVLDRKTCKGGTFLICDGGSNQHASSAFLGRHIRNNFPMHVLNRDKDMEEVTIAGPLCTPTDIIGQKVRLPKTAVGDYIVVEKSGAYGLTYSPVCFLSHVTPAEVMLVNRKAYVIREKGRFEDIVKGQSCPF